MTRNTTSTENKLLLTKLAMYNVRCYNEIKGVLSSKLTVLTADHISNKHKSL